MFVAFDSDGAMNENVQTNERLLAAALQARGAIVKIVRFPPGPDGGESRPRRFSRCPRRAGLWKLLESAEEPEAVDAALIKQPAAQILPEDEARRIIRANEQDGVPRLVRWRDGWLWYANGRYGERSEAEASAEVTAFLNQSWLKVTRHAVGDVIAQLRAQTILPNSFEPPAWRGKAPVDWNPRDLLLAAQRHLPLAEHCRGQSRPASCRRLQNSFAQVPSILSSRSTHRSPIAGCNSWKSFGPMIPTLLHVSKKCLGIYFPPTRRNRRFSF